MSEDARARLEPLRTELGQIDREILAAVSKRQAVAQKIGQIKRDAGIPTRDYRQERDVVERARAAAAPPGGAPPQPATAGTSVTSSRAPAPRRSSTASRRRSARN